MSRLARLAVAAVAAVTVAAPAAGADPLPPPCQLHWEPFLTTTPGFPVYVEVDRPSHWTC